MREEERRAATPPPAAAGAILDLYQDPHPRPAPDGRRVRHLRSGPQPYYTQPAVHISWAGTRESARTVRATPRSAVMWTPLLAHKPAPKIRLTCAVLAV